MRRIISEKRRFYSQVVSRDFVREHHTAQPFKVELLDKIPEDQDVKMYWQGEFYELCKGPHVYDMGQLGGAFKLTKVAGAYWQGDSTKTMLSRISGVYFAEQKQLDQFLVQQAEAEKRDHRKLGKQLDLFHFEEQAPGSVFWHPKGWSLFQKLINYMRETQNEAGYQEINTPDMMDKSLWEISGHWQNYHANMFTTTTEDKREFAFKPMNCPGHMMVYNQGIRSYKSLPLRLAEFGKVHRYEPSGALHGLMRVRSFTQDDAHIFCTEEQLLDECIAVNNLIFKIYKDFGFKGVRVKLSTMPENHIGSIESWEKATNALKDALEKLEQPYTIFEGEGAFYGPKLEYVLTDAIGRDWQCGTLQVDFNLPARFNSTYMDKDGKHKHPVMLHRAMFGSLERFTGILIEHYAGNLPVWLQPTQVAIVTVSDSPAQVETANRISGFLKNYSASHVIDARVENLSAKISEQFKSKVPYVLVIGDQEAERLGEVVSVREIGGKSFRLPVGEFLEELSSAIREKR
ncbi:Threonine--tRNA ligase [compost metagenome]